MNTVLHSLLIVHSEEVETSISELWMIFLGQLRYQT